MQHLTNDALHAKAYRIIGELSLVSEPDDVLQALADAGLHLVEDQPLALNEIVTEMGVVWSVVETSLAALGKAQDALSKLAGLLASPPPAGTAQSGSEPAPTLPDSGAVPSPARAPVEAGVEGADVYLQVCLHDGCHYRAAGSPEALDRLLERHFRVDHGEDTR